MTMLPVDTKWPRGKPGNHLGTRWRGKLPIPPHAHPFMRELIKIANAQQTTLSEISERAGVPTKTMSEWRYRCAPGIDAMQAALNVLDYEIVIRRKRS